jgi:hypothetical protein
MYKYFYGHGGLKEIESEKGKEEVVMLYSFKILKRMLLKQLSCSNTKQASQGRSKEMV